MNASVRILVGDGYEKFTSDNPMVETASNFISALENRVNMMAVEKVLIGQGISRVLTEKICTLLEGSSIEAVNYDDSLAPLYLTHKVDLDNVLVTNPKNIGAGKYAFQLTTNEQLDRLSDHVTGQHIGGMILMEAARQAGIVACEIEFGNKYEGNLEFALEEFDSKFLGFCFPVATNIIAVVEEYLKGNSKAVRIVVDFDQDGRAIFQANIRVTIYKNGTLDVVEKKKAKRAVRQAIKSIDENNIRKDIDVLSLDNR